VGQFRSCIHVWDIINEAHDWVNDPNHRQQQLVELTKMATEATRLADPTAFRIVNNCCVCGESINLGTAASAWVGPAIVGIFLAPPGEAGVMWIFAILYAISAVRTMFMKVEEDRA
jgi:hypothetical protein